MKDEMKGKVMIEYVGLKPKMYSMSSISGSKQSAKCVNRAVKETLHHSLYRKVLEEEITIRREMTSLRSRNLSMYLEKVNKFALSSFDDERYIDGSYTKAFCHYSIATPRK